MNQELSDSGDHMSNSHAILPFSMVRSGYWHQKGCLGWSGEDHSKVFGVVMSHQKSIEEDNVIKPVPVVFSVNRWLYALSFVRVCKLLKKFLEGSSFECLLGHLPNTSLIWSLIFPAILQSDCYCFLFAGEENVVQRHVQFYVQNHTARVMGNWIEFLCLMILWLTPQS